MAMHGGGGGHGSYLGMSRSPGAIDEDEEALGKVYDHKVVSRLFQYVGSYKKQAGISVFMMLIYTFTNVAQPWIIKIGIDSVIELTKQGSFTDLLIITGIFSVNALVNFGSNYAHLVSLAKVSQGVLYSLRAHIFAHLQRLSLSFFDKNEVGRIMSRGQNDVSQLQEFLGIAILTLGDVLSLAGIVGALLLMNAKLALLTMTVIPVLGVIMLLWQRIAWDTFMRVRRAISVVNANLQENISGVRVVQSLNREKTNIDMFDRLNHSHLDANLGASRLSATLMPTVEILTAVAIGMVVIFGGHMVLNGELAVSTIVAFILYIQRFFDPIRNITMQYTQFQRAMTSGVRIFNLLDTKPEISDSANAYALEEITGEVTLEDVHFHYVPGVEVTKGISLQIAAGETVALVGETGAGKSTIISLINRFYDVTEGRILLDGYDIREVTRDSLAKQTAIVPQEPFLFSGTITDNIKYNSVTATEEEVTAAAKTVGAHYFIERLPKGYATQLQERGQNLSLGQRQLLSFARALLANPRVLILDEATANIDSYTEGLIQQALKEVLHGRTAIVIAHRLSTIRNADRIILLKNGEIVEQGNHAELMDLGKGYAELYSTYFQGDNLPQE